MLCPKCNTVNSDDEKFCKNCGFQLTASRICPECGKVNEHNSKYCEDCGATLSPVNTFKRDIIGESRYSFFNKYKSLIIAALILFLVIGAVTGIAIYSSNTSDGDGDNIITPLIPMSNKTDEGISADNNTTDADANRTVNASNNNTNNSVNASKNDTDKSANADNATNKTVSSGNNTNNSNSLVDMMKNLTDSDNKSNNGSKANPDTNKSSDNNAKNNQNANRNIVENGSEKNTTGGASINDTSDNDTGSDNINNTSDTSDEIELNDVPNLAQKVSGTGYSFSEIDYNGNTYTKAQCLYIFTKYVVKVNNSDSSSIKFKSFSKASNPSGDDESQSIDKSDYLDIAERINRFMDSNGKAPNYIGISGPGAADLSTDKMLELYTQIVLIYSISEDLPSSVDI